jgi:hypothetical protein
MVETAQPFSALIGISSLLVALLYVAGFAYRWSYYYNFGVQHVVFKLGVQSFLVTAIELIRTPRHLLDFVIWVIGPLVLFNVSLAAIRVVVRRVTALKLLFGKLGSGSRLTADLLRAAILVFATYLFASQIGYDEFRSDLVDSKSNSLPAVTAIVEGRGFHALSCGAVPDKATQFIGDAERLRTLQEAYRSCNSQTITWRLLYRDDSEIYLFASRAAGTDSGGRPLTLVLPNKDIYLLME